MTKDKRKRRDKKKKKLSQEKPFSSQSQLLKVAESSPNQNS